MEHSFEDLEKKTVAELVEIAQGLEHEALEGHSTMRKAALLQAVCTALGIDPHKHHDVVGVDKDALKAKIRALKGERSAALEARDPVTLRRVRRKIHRLKRRIRRATV